MYNSHLVCNHKRELLLEDFFPDGIGVSEVYLNHENRRGGYELLTNQTLEPLQFDNRRHAVCGEARQRYIWQIYSRGPSVSLTGTPQRVGTMLGKLSGMVGRRGDNDVLIMRVVEAEFCRPSQGLRGETPSVERLCKIKCLHVLEK